MQLYRADTVGPRYYLDLFGANHFTPYEGSGAPEPIVAKVTTDFLDRYLAGQHPAAAAMRRAGQVAGVATLAMEKFCFSVANPFSGIRADLCVDACTSRTHENDGGIDVLAATSSFTLCS